ncbi:MAG: fimbrillin family protein, partial [Alistipes senegalensis]
MLKKTLLSIMAAAAMTACSQVETTSVNPDPEGTGYITFSPVVPKATRGTVTKIDQLKNQGFYVVAYGENSFYFNRLLAEYKEAADDNKGAGFYLPGKYSWPSYELTFSAWYPPTLPANGGSATAYDKDGNVMAGQYVSQPVWSGDGSGLEKGQEIRGFVPATVHANQTDIVIARTKATSATYGKGQPVKLNFRHILSQVSFKAKKKSGDQLRIEIKEIELRNIPSKGNFVFRKSNDFTTDGNVTEGTTNPTLIPADHWEIIAPTGSNLTYGDEAGNNVNLQRYKHTLSTP